MITNSPLTDVFQARDIPFDFPFYGEDVNRIAVTTQGKNKLVIASTETKISTCVLLASTDTKVSMQCTNCCEF